MLLFLASGVWWGWNGWWKWGGWGGCGGRGWRWDGSPGNDGGSAGYNPRRNCEKTSGLLFLLSGVL